MNEVFLFLVSWTTDSVDFGGHCTIGDEILALGATEACSKAILKDTSYVSDAAAICLRRANKAECTKYWRL